MTAVTIDPSAAERNEEDYTGACCLLVREQYSRKHAKLEALIDADRLPDVAPLDWVIWRRRKRHRIKYIVCMTPMPGARGWILGLHRFLMDPPEDMVVDHRNRIPWDNRSKNLRVCTSQQNSFNTSPTKGRRSKFKGVSHKGGRASKYNPWVWAAMIGINGKPVLIGHFVSQAHAAYAYNVFAERHRGEYAYLNDVALTPTEQERVYRIIERYAEDRRRRQERCKFPPPPPPPKVKPILYAVDLVELDDPFSPENRPGRFEGWDVKGETPDT